MYDLMLNYTQFPSEFGVSKDKINFVTELSTLIYLQEP
jgi:hypothetical protein